MNQYRKLARERKSLMKIKNAILQKIDNIDENLFQFGIELDLIRYGFHTNEEEEEEEKEKILKTFSENQLGNLQNIFEEEEDYDTDDVKEISEEEIKKLI